MAVVRAAARPPWTAPAGPTIESQVPQATATRGEVQGSRPSAQAWYSCGPSLARMMSAIQSAPGQPEVGGDETARHQGACPERARAVLSAASCGSVLGGSGAAGSTCRSAAGSYQIRL